MIPDFFTRFSDVWSSTVHALISHNSNGKIVDRSSMVLTAHNFRSHVTWCTGSVLGILRSPDSCYTEISYSHVAIIVDNEVLWLNISMNNLFFVAVFQTSDKTGNEEP